MRHAQVEHLLPEYLHGTLGLWHRLSVAFHLKRCAPCREEARQIAEALALLSQAVEQVDPPPALAQRVLARLEPPPGALRGLPFPLRIPTTWLLSGTMSKIIVALGLVILLVAGGMTAWGMYLSKRMGNLEAGNREIQEALQDQRQLVYQVANPEVKEIPLEAPPEDGQARGVFMAQPEGRWGTLVAIGLMPLGAEGTYQVWLVAFDGSHWRAGFLLVDDTGWGQVDIRTEIPVKEFRAIWVSVEPAGGSRYPRGRPVLGGEIQLR